MLQIVRLIQLILKPLKICLVNNERIHLNIQEKMEYKVQKCQ